MDKDKDLDMLQDFSELHVLPFDVDLDEDLHATKVFKVYDFYWTVISEPQQVLNQTLPNKKNKL